MKKKIALILVFFVLLSYAALADVNYSDYISLNSAVKYKYIGRYDTTRLDKILSTELKDFSDYKISYAPAHNSVKLYRVIYMTVVPEKRNKPVIASGLIALPETNNKLLPVVSYQHGTVFSRTEVPSNPEESNETRLMVAAFAGNGYAVIAPDYIGKGVSDEPDSFLAKESSAQACFDMYAASKAVVENLGIKFGDFFISGWSQGSWVTLTFLNRLEFDGIPVTGCATAATPCDPYTLFSAWIFSPKDITPQWMLGVPILILNCYENYYGMSGLVDVSIKPAYRQTVKDLYANKITWDEACKNLPMKLKDLLNDDFVQNWSLLNNRFYEQLNNNTVYRWRFKTKTRFYYGDADEVIYTFIATLSADFQNFSGAAKAENIFAGKDADHRKTFLFGIRDQKVWFDNLKTQ